MEKRRNLILFTGDSSAALRKNLSAWTASFVEKYGDSNVATIRIGETDPAFVASELLSMPFFADKRLVVFEGVPRLRAGGSTAQDEGPDAEDAGADNASDPAAAIEAAVLSVFEKIPESTIAIFVSETPNKVSALYKKLVAEGDVKAFEGLHAGNVEDFVRDRLPGITGKALSALVERSVKNPDRKRNEPMEIDDRKIRNAVEKLSLGYGESAIGEKELDEAEPPLSNQKAFSIADAVLAGKLNEAVSILRSVLEKDSPFVVFPTVASMVRKALHVEMLRRSGKAPAEIAEITGYNAWYVSNRGRMSDAEYRAAQAAYSALVKFETDWRTGNAPGEDDAAALECGLVSAVLAGRKNA